MPRTRVYRWLLLLLPLVLVAAAWAQTTGTGGYARALHLRSALDGTAADRRTPAQYARTLDAFRVVYHADRAAPHAGESVEAVAELLAAEGRLFHDPTLLRAAVEQLDFLRRDFSATPYAMPALLTEGEIELRDLSDRASAQDKFSEFLREYPASPLAPQARAELRRLGVRVASPTETASRTRRQTTTAPSFASPAQSSSQPGADDADTSPAATPAASTTRSNAGAAPPASGMWTPASPSETPSATQPPANPSIDASGPARLVNAVPIYRPVRHTIAPGKLMLVNGIRHWSTANYTRVVVDVGDEVPFEASRVSNPDRIFFDFHGTRLAPDLAGRAVTVTDGGFLQRIRAAQFSDDTVRVVLDVTDVSDYSAFWLPNPSRLIIDIHGRSKGAPPPVYANVAPQKPLQSGAQMARNGAAAQSNGQQTEPPPQARVPSQQTAAAPAINTARATNAASMMADASGNLSPAVRAARSGAPQPRAARVAAPGTFVAETAAPGDAGTGPRAGDSVAAIAALSQQPSRVRATAAPTLAPVASGTPADTPSTAPPITSSASRKHGRHEAMVAAAPPPETPGAAAQAAAPDALGGRSMVRALGLKINRIVIDAGHGGHDSGTLGPGGIEEKDVVLDVALRLGKLLKERLGADIIYTRDDDTFIPLENRTAIANKAQADLFISIHANSSSDPSATGVETYYLNFTTSADSLEVAARENAVSDESIHQLSDLVKKITLQDKIEESREFASDVQQSLFHGLEAGNPNLKDRGVKKAPFVVLIGANMPSILAEISFLTNPHSADELREPAYRERIAESLYHGVAAYISSLGRAPSQERAATADGSGSRN